MRDTYLQWLYGDGQISAWAPVSEIPTGDLLKHLECMANGDFETAPDSPNLGQSHEECRDRILIELRAREMGLV